MSLGGRFSPSHRKDLINKLFNFLNIKKKNTEVQRGLAGIQPQALSILPTTSLVYVFKGEQKMSN